MKEELNILAKALESLEPEASEKIRSLAGRYDKAPNSTPPALQPAYKYIMYLKLMKGLDDATFHHMKRKYMDTSLDIQEECRKELAKVISHDALNGTPSSAEIRREFESRLKESGRSST